MLACELIEALQQAPPDAIVTAHIDHSIRMEADEWSGATIGILCRDFEVTAAVLSRGYDGDKPGRFVCLGTGKEV